MVLRRIVDVGHIIQNAVIFDVKNWSGDTMNSESSLLQAVERLFSLLEERKIHYVLVGGIALLRYVDGRNTQDIDLIMAPSALRELPEISISSQDNYFAHGEFEGLQIDLLLTENPLFNEVQQKYVRFADFLNRKMPLASVEGLLLLKLYALPSLYRQGNFVNVGIYENDIAVLMHAYKPDILKLLGVLSHYLSDNDLEELKGIVGEIKQRIKRFEESN
ncbi:MAG TPA: nucleotidyltransferase family protein [Anaerolineae bacterium]|nr:nucleotidyltransferase family protein [Anaerolineae bacterium]